MTTTLARQHPATLAFTYPLPPEQMAEIDPSDVWNGDILVNRHGHLIGYVAIAQHDTYGTLTIGAPSGCWTMDTTNLNSPIFLAVSSKGI